MKKYFFLYLIINLLGSVNAVLAAFDTLPPNKIADFLGWVKAPINICGGYYKEPAIVANYPKPSPAKKTKVVVTAKKRAIYSAHGTSVLEGNVVLTQPGREITADKMVFHRDSKTDKIVAADLIGHVHFREFGKVIIGDHGYANFKTKVISIDHAIYHISTKSPTGQVDVWGRARHLVRDKLGVVNLDHATYSTCQPNSETWGIASGKLHLNKKAGVGTLYNGILYFKRAPILYLPYLRFPIDKRRRSGFLYPSFGYSNKSGFRFALPFYLNLAPNYDFTFTPHFYYRRGVLSNGLLRYLTDSSKGKLGVGYIFHDRLFSKFKKSSLTKYKNISAQGKALDELENSNTNRAAFSWQNSAVFNPNWSSKLDLNYVTDNYYLNDFGNSLSTINDNQLLNKFDLNYDSMHWHFLGRLQGYQTLHLVTDKNAVEEQYYRLPQLDLNADYPAQGFGLAYHMAANFVNFMHEKTKPAIVTGQRANLQPGVSLPLSWAGGFFIPQAQLQSTFYTLQDQKPGYPFSISRVLPIFDVDSGLIFERNLKLFRSDYLQTLEPRLFYLYIPRAKQDKIPIFDGSLTSFNADDLFRVNRFSSIDRVGDANQLSYAITSRFLDSETGQQKLSASLGQIYAFRQHKVAIVGGDDPLLTTNWSPIVAQLIYNMTPAWSVNGNVAWNYQKKAVNTGEVSLQYNPATNQIFNIGYTFQQASPKNLELVDVSAVLPVRQHWHIFADWNYDIASENSLAYLYGLEYNSCCWALRAVASKILTGYDSAKQKNIFRDEYYIQFMLKGLGSVGSHRDTDLLTKRISGFHEDFVTGLLK